MRTGGRGGRAWEKVVWSDRRLLGTLVILAGAVLGWTLAVELAIGWMAVVGLAAALALVVLIWLWPEREEPEEPPL
ncbi:MAG: hypothetical protein ACREIR_12020 [Geminicoccaceae bacterium]